MTPKELRRRVVTAPLRPGERREPPAEPFDWAGVVVGHWFAARADGQDKHGGRVYRCVSRCGVATRLTASSLSAGGPATCEGCRAGSSAPPVGRTVAESEMPAHLARWENPMTMNVRSNLKGKQAISDWEAFALPAVTRLLADTPQGAAYGWALFVRDCHERARPKGEAVVRVKSHHVHPKEVVPGRPIRTVDDTGANASFFTPGAFVLQQLGVKTAGRKLDGREWDEFPEVAQ